MKLTCILFINCLFFLQISYILILVLFIYNTILGHIFVDIFPICYNIFEAFQVTIKVQNTHVMCHGNHQAWMKN